MYALFIINKLIYEIVIQSHPFIATNCATQIISYSKKHVCVCVNFHGSWIRSNVVWINIAFLPKYFSLWILMWIFPHRRRMKTFQKSPEFTSINWTREIEWPVRENKKVLSTDICLILWFLCHPRILGYDYIYSCFGLEHWNHILKITLFFHAPGNFQTNWFS